MQLCISITPLRLTLPPHSPKKVEILPVVEVKNKINVFPFIFISDIFDNFSHLL